MTDRPPLLAGKIGLVTGGGSGMGRAAALAMAREGADLLLVGRREMTLRLVAEEIMAMGRLAEIYPADVTQRAVCRDAWPHLAVSISPSIMRAGMATRPH
jgi:NADP-dependent 3-hydroxy acid dehydrogenase YdfG